MSQAVVAAVVVLFAAVVTAGPMKLYQKADNEKFRHGKFSWFPWDKLSGIMVYHGFSFIYVLFLPP